jgi:hypothetical protein
MFDWDWRRFQPTTTPGSGVPTFTTAVPALEALKQAALANPEVTHQWNPNAKPGPQPTLDDQLKTLQRPEYRGIIAGPTGPAPAPSPRPPSMTMFPGLPMGPHTPESTITAPPSVPVKGVGAVPLLGPGTATPAVTGAPITPATPETQFGNPATREALRTLPATPARGGLDDIMEKVKRGDFNGAIEGLAKNFPGGGGGGGAARPSEVNMPQAHGPRLQPHQPNTSGELAKIMAGLPSVEERQKFKQQQARRRKTQDKYDLENWRQ